MSPALSVTIPADIEGISAVCRDIRGVVAERTDTDMAARVELVLAEALNNVVEHGYQGGSEQPIQVELFVEAEAIRVVVIDHSRQQFVFPTHAAMPDFDPDDHDTFPEGGFGLAIILQCTDQVLTERHGDANHLILEFRKTEP
jgi:serine/threonine-protein kinase RsbW